MLKKINNYHLYTLILIVFILNTILFRSIDITKAQWTSPESTPGEQTTNIVVNPLQEDLNLGGNKMFGVGYVGLGITTNTIENPFIVSNNIGDGGIISSFYDPIMGNTDIMHLRIGKDNSVGNAGLLSFYYNGNNSGENYLGLGINNAADTLIITKDGDVGIGTTSPSHELQIANGTFHIGGPGSAGYVEATALGVVNLRAVDAGGASVIKSDADAKLHLLNGNLKGIIIHENGNVGIGTEQPNKNLHIYDANNAEIDLQSVGVPGDGGHWGIYHDGLSDDLKFWHGNEDRLTMTDDGNVGINSITPPEWELELHPNKDNGRSGLLIKADTENSYVTFTRSDEDNLNHATIVNKNDGTFRINHTGSSGDAHLVILSDGNVGIGTASPISIFNIAGSHTTAPMVLSGNVPSLYFHDTEQGIETETADADNRYDSWMMYADGGSLYFGRKDNMNSNTPGFDSIDMHIDHTGTLHANMGDINLSNKYGDPNEVDGTRGSWTIQEGDKNLFVINRNTGEKYKIVLDKVK